MSILGNPIMIGGGGGGGGNVAVQLHGAPGETVTWSDGTNTGTVTLSGVGDDGSLVLPAGGYSFTFSLGSAVTGAIAATLTQGVTAVVNGWGGRTPAYWFGREFGYTTGQTNNPSVTYNTNNISMSNVNGSLTRSFFFNGLVKGSNTMAKAYVDTTGSYNSAYGQAHCTGTNITTGVGYAGGNTGVTLTGTVTADTTLGVSYRPSSNTTAGGVNLYAIWLE